MQPAAPIVVALLASLVVTLPWERDGAVSYSLDRVTTPLPQDVNITTAEYTRRPAYFKSQGVMCHAWLYMPKHTPAAPPIVIMAHGLGAQKDFGLHKTADRFAAHGLAVLVFDYRSFGASDGEPRHWVSPRRHLEDWRAAVRFAQGLGAKRMVNSKKLVLWGSSFGAGHALVTAAEIGATVTAVVAQVPHLSGIEASKRALKVRGVLGTVRLLVVAVHDRVRSMLGMAPAYVPLVARLGELGLMVLDEHELQRYFSKHPLQKMGGWQNKALARLALETSNYSPINHLDAVAAPVLFISAAHDALCPAELVHQAVAKLGSKAELLQMQCTHFDVYSNDVWDVVVSRTLLFLDKRLNKGPPVLTQ